MGRFRADDSRLLVAGSRMDTRELAGQPADLDRASRHPKRAWVVRALLAVMAVSVLVVMYLAFPIVAIIVASLLGLALIVGFSSGR